MLLPGFPNPVRLGIAVDIDPAGLPLRRGPLQPARRRGRRPATARPCGCSRANGSTATSSCASAMAPARSAALALVPDDDGRRGHVHADGPAAGGRGAAGPRDVVLVLDRSGSMGGWKMVAARRAAARIVDTLTAAATGSPSWPSTPRSRRPTTSARASSDGDRPATGSARSSIWRGVDARGGTELLAPLRRGRSRCSTTRRDATGSWSWSPTARSATRTRSSPRRHGAARRAGPHRRHRPGRERRLPRPSRRRRRGPLRAGRARGPAGRGDGAHPPPDRRAGRDRPVA